MATPADTSPLDTQAIAAEALAALDGKRQITPFSSRLAGFDLRSAYRAAAQVQALRVARGERPLGRKIGFTNSGIWPEYGVFAPIWGPMYQHSVHDIAALGGRFALAGLLQPRIEPEIVFGLGRAPTAGMDDAALMGCIVWVAHGFEIVHSIFPDWRFTAADTVAAFGLHGALLLGPLRPVGADAQAWRDGLPRFAIELLWDGEVVDQGQGTNVLGSPLAALRHLIELLAADAAQPPLAAGEIITTGTLTRALPIAAGQRWQTRLDGIPLPGLDLQFD